MIRPPHAALALGTTVALALLTACADSPTAAPLVAATHASVAAATSLPSGERFLGNGNVSIEPAYDDVTGAIIYLSTPVKSPFPTHTSVHAVSPLYLVEYPPGSTVGTLNCMKVPGNCPDHDGIVAGVATSVMPTVYGTDPALVPGHDHLVDPPGGSEWNVAWEVYEVLFTSTAAAREHITTDAALDAAVARGDAIVVDLGFAFHCAVTAAPTYWRGTPVGG